MSDADLMRRAAARLREVLPSFTDPRHYANHADIALVRELEARSQEDCVHCGDPVQPDGHDDWVHASGLYRCQSPDVPYGHLAHPEGIPCRADGPNPCLGARS